MIDGAVLSRLLHAVSTGYPERALNLVQTADGLDADERSQLYAAITEQSSASEQARGLGDVFLSLGADQTFVNEAYRAAFYLGSDWAALADNPLYAQFTANKASAVLDKWIHYFPIYTAHLAAYQGRDIKVLEIGVYRGGGLAMLAHYLGPGARVVGLDVDEAARRSVNDRFPVVVGDQEDPQVLRSLNDEYGPFDIIIDDGGHTMAQQIASIEALFPLLNDDGVYIVEDTHTSYWESMGGGLRHPDTFVEWAKARVDDLHSRHLGEIDPDTVWATHVTGMHFYDSVVVLQKKRRFRPFNEVAGTSSYLFADRFSEAVGVELLATRDAARQEAHHLRDQLEAAYADRVSAVPPRADVADELATLRIELARAREETARVDAGARLTEAELQRLQNQLLESWQQIQDLRRTLSWRMTAPLRSIRRQRTR